MTDKSEFKVEFKLPEPLKHIVKDMSTNLCVPENVVFGTLKEGMNGAHIGIPNGAVYDHLQDWLDLIKKQNKDKDKEVWSELPCFPGYRFKNLVMVNHPYKNDEKDFSHVIHFTYDEKIIYKETT